MKTTVRVENQNFLDMTVYVLRLSQRLRLGTVPGLSTRVLVIPEHIISGAASVRLLADPLGSNKTPISREFSVTPGDQIEMIISN